MILQAALDFKTLDEALAAHRERNEKLLEALPPPAEK